MSAFNLRWLANKVTPKTLKIKWKGNMFEQAIIKKAECSLIHNRIKCTNIKINHLQTEIANTKTFLQCKVDEPPTFTNLQNTIFNNKEKTIIQIKNTQIKKLKHLISRTSTTTPKMALQTTNTFNTAVTSSSSSSIQDRWVINLSKKELTPAEVFTTERSKICSYPSNLSHQRKHLHYYWQLSRQVNSIVLTALAVEFLTPMPINQYIRTSPRQNI